MSKKGVNLKGTNLSQMDEATFNRLLNGEILIAITSDKKEGYSSFEELWKGLSIKDKILILCLKYIRLPIESKIESLSLKRMIKKHCVVVRTSNNITIYIDNIAEENKLVDCFVNGYYNDLFNSNPKILMEFLCFKLKEFQMRGCYFLTTDTRNWDKYKWTGDDDE